MSKRLSADQIKAFHEDGVTFPVPVLSPSAIQKARKQLDAVLQSGGPSPARDFLGYKSNLVFRWLDDIAHTPALLDVVEDLLGRDILLWSCTFAIKPPRSQGRYTWHQDATYWGLTPPIALTCWLAFGKVGPKNGGMRFLRGSHRLGVLPHRNTFSSNNFLFRGQEIEALPRHCVEVASCLQPGEISVHDSLTAHSSGPNESDEPRIGCLLIFIPTFVRHERQRESAMLMRGFDRFGYHDLEERPSGDMLAAEIHARNIAMAKMGTYQDETRLAASKARP
jgi:hypothetical protein